MYRSRFFWWVGVVNFFNFLVHFSIVTNSRSFGYTHYCYYIISISFKNWMCRKMLIGCCSFVYQIEVMQLNLKFLIPFVKVFKLNHINNPRKYISLTL